ncbi:MAG: hypothetical protein ACD_18C00093G0001 [uncultured bacterium]|nr:MAG: hypothetical protein ACD_18C00093G0001 [uncultured bacterium]
MVYFSSIFLLVLGSVNSYYWFGILFLGMIVYLKKFYLRFFSFSQDLNFGKKILGILVLPFVIVMGDIFKMLGWPVGVFERLTGDIKFQL